MRQETCPVLLKSKRPCGKPVQATRSLERRYTFEGGVLREMQHLESCEWRFHCEDDHELPDVDIDDYPEVSA